MAGETPERNGRSINAAATVYGADRDNARPAGADGPAAGCTAEPGARRATARAGPGRRRRGGDPAGVNGGTDPERPRPTAGGGTGIRTAR